MSPPDSARAAAHRPGAAPPTRAGGSPVHEVLDDVQVIETKKKYIVFLSAIGDIRLHFLVTYVRVVLKRGVNTEIKNIKIVSR